MNPADALATAAQIAIALAGFTGVVAVFGRGSVDEWPLINQFRLRLMVAFSTMPLILSLAGLLLFTTNLPVARIDDLCSGFAIVLVAPAGIFFTREFIMLGAERARMGTMGRTIFYSGSIVGTAPLILQVCNLAVLHTFWPFFTAVVVSIAAATLQFARLVLIGHKA